MKILCVLNDDFKSVMPTRYTGGVRKILECFFDGSPIRDPYLIVQDGQLAGMGAHSYSKGSSTSGSEEAANYKK
jgi:formate dehydrogenase